MKYKDFKIFKFSTISKNIYLIKDSFSKILKKIKNIPIHIADSFSDTLKGIFSNIYKNTKNILDKGKDLLNSISPINIC